MNLRGILADYFYRYFGCCYNNKYNRRRVRLFHFIESKIPNDFLRKNLCDLGCGDGSNTLELQKLFRPSSVTGYERNKYLVKKAIAKGFKVKSIDLNQELPSGEMATFTFSLHHLKDKEGALNQVVKNFNYLFLCEPIKDIYHTIFEGGCALTKNEWLALFNKTLGKYQFYQYESNIIVFYIKT